MLYFLMCRGHERNVKPLLESSSGPKPTILHYDTALGKSTLPRGTYIFTSIDRLGVVDLAAAARLFRRLKENGCRVLNDPAQVRTRFSLLRALHREGLNSFNAYSADEHEKPERFPVFVRRIRGHAPPLSDLIWDQAALDRMIEAAVVAGFPRSDLMVVEYAAEPVRPGLFRKLSIFRVGDQFLAHACVHDTSWLVKTGRPGIADEALYEDELAIVRENRFAERLKPVFFVAHIDYGRVDFGLVGDQICVYEINTNPVIQVSRQHPFPQRLETVKLWRQRLSEALASLQPDGALDADAEIDVGGDSVEALQHALALFPSLRNAHMRLAREFTRRSAKAAAIAALRSGIAEHPDDAGLRFKLSELLENDSSDEAIAALERVIALVPHKPDPLLAKANLLIKAGRDDAAREAIAKAFTMKPDRSRLHRAMIHIQRRFGTPAAVKAAELALKLRASVARR